MAMSKKQKAALLAPFADYDIYHGAVRSGKTFISIVRLLDIIRKTPNPNNYPFLMSGFSKESLKKNVLDELFKFIGEENYKIVDNKITLFGKYKIEFFGGALSNSEQSIRGRTYAGWYADEVTLHHKSFVSQAVARCSIPKARMIWTTNPDHPEHFILKDYIDNKKLSKNVFHFYMDENPTLTESYKQRLKDSFSGVFYDRNVLGKWVLADGLVYADFKKDTHTFTQATAAQMVASKQFKYYIAGSDWGFTDPMTGLLFGVTHSNEYYLLEEFYKTQMQTEDLIKWYQQKEIEIGQKINMIVCDTSEPDRIQKLKMNKLNSIMARKEINIGLNAVMITIKSNRLFINENAVETIKEMLTYSYPEKDSVAAKLDKPLDKYNHAMDALRYAVYMHELLMERKAVVPERRKKRGLY